MECAALSNVHERVEQELDCSLFASDQGQRQSLQASRFPKSRFQFRPRVYRVPNARTLVEHHEGPLRPPALPILANPFLHYAFDMWMTRTYPHIPFERYADDAICHCKSSAISRQLFEPRLLWAATVLASFALYALLYMSCDGLFQGYIRLVTHDHQIEEIFSRLRGPLIASRGRSCGVQLGGPPHRVTHDGRRGFLATGGAPPKQRTELSDTRPFPAIDSTAIAPYSNSRK